MIQKADIIVPTATNTEDIHKTRLDTFSHPKRSTPRKVLSKKKDKMTSAAKAGPMTSPIVLE